MNTNKIQNHESFKKLHRKVDKVSRLRYNAADRLKRHQQFSQWITTLLSVILIIVPLLQALKVKTNVNDQLLNAIQVFLAVLILAYSLLLGIENYSSRSEKMHTCGLELSSLAREIDPYLEIENDSFLYKIFSKKYQSLYKIFSEKYQSILEKYENHSQIDNNLYDLKIRKKSLCNQINKTKKINIKRIISYRYLIFYCRCLAYIGDWLFLNFVYWLNYWHYAVVSIGCIGIIYYVFSASLFK
jgi:hypothetical protein